MDETNLNSQPFRERFSLALSYANRLHAAQKRKGTDIPYISHLIAVSSYVIEAGGDEDEAIAALLHDGPEDQGGDSVLKEIERRFGDRVAEIVAGCTDTVENPKPDWRPRKEAYLARLPTESPSVHLVSSADKLHNARCMLNDYRRLGDALWDRFRVGRDEQLWFLRSIARIYRECGTSPLTHELEQVIDELEAQ